MEKPRETILGTETEGLIRIFNEIVVLDSLNNHGAGYFK